MKKIFKVLIVVTVLCLSVGAFAACNDRDGGKKPVETAKPTSFVTLDINPSVDFVLDQNGVVLSVNAANEDAEVMLYGEEGDIVGKPVDEAAKKVAELAVECNYLTEENKAIGISVAVGAGATENESALYAKITASVDASAIVKGVGAVVEKTVDFFAEAELAAVKEKNAGKPGYDDSLTVAKFRLVKKVMANDYKVKMDDAVKMSVEELSKKANEINEYYKDKLNNAYEQAYAAAERAYNGAVETVMDAAYAKVYADRPFDIKNPTAQTFNNGTKYVAYRLAYRTLDGIVETARAYAANPVIKARDIENIAGHLGVTKAEIAAAIGCEEKDLTVENIKEYVNKQYRNMTEAERTEYAQAKAEVSVDVLGIEASASAFADEDSAAIDIAIGGLKASLSVSMSEELRSALDNIKEIKDVDQLLEIIQKEIDNVKAEIDKELTAEEKARVKEIQDENREKIAAAEKKFQETVAQAKAEAKAALESAKKARIEMTVSVG